MELFIVNILYYTLFLSFVLIGLFVFAKSKDSSISKKFLFLMLSVALWVGTNYSLRLVSDKYALFILRSTYASAGLMLFSVLIFSLSFPRKIIKTKTVEVVAALVTIFVIVLSFSSLLIPSYSKTDFIFYPTYGKGFNVFMVLILVIVAMLIINSVIQYKNSQGMSKKQVLLFTVGFILSAVLASTTDLIVPLITGNSLSANFGPLGTIFLLAFTAYAVTKHSLLNTRVILSEIWAILLVISIFIWLLGHFSIGNLIGFLFIFMVCFQFIRAVISDSEKDEKLEGANKHLEKDKKELVELDRMKDEFLQMATHELNTPITVIKGKLDMAIREDMCKLNDEQKKFFEPILADTQRLSNLSDDILNVARIDQHRLKIRPSETDLDEFISQIVSGFDIKAKERDNSLAYIKLSKSLPKMMVDQSKIGEVITNLVNNANKFTEHGKIVVTSKLKDDGVIISVADTGVGIEQEDQKHLFEKFYQAARFDPENPQEQQGSGLGLYISKNIIELHGGKIWLESEKGKGSTFYFSLPLEYKIVEQPKKMHIADDKLRML